MKATTAILLPTVTAMLSAILVVMPAAQAAERPNILYIMTDDHAAHAMSCYGSVVNKTPNLDRIANAGVRFDNCFVTNSICTPSRATIITGKYSHINACPYSTGSMGRSRPCEVPAGGWLPHGPDRQVAPGQ